MKNVSRINAMERRFFRKIQGNERRDRVRNEVMRHNLRIESISNEVIEMVLICVQHDGK